MHHHRRNIGVVIAGTLMATVISMESPMPASAATGTVYFRGTVTCPEGHVFAGAWVKNSTGKSDFASKAILPGTSDRQARIGRTFTDVPMPTTVSINVGCGIKDGNQWRYVYNDLGKVTATRTGTVFINVGCTTTSCTAGARGRSSNNTTWNPASQQSASTLYGQEWCTYRASEFWKQMTGSYPGWGGDAGYWDDSDRAPAWGWNVRSWPETDSLMIWQPGTAGAVGHVGYVADIRRYDGRTQVKIYDRNADNRPYDGVLFDRPNTTHDGWINIPAGARFIRVPARFTPYNR